MAGESAVLDVKEIKTVPYVPLSHPFAERLIDTIRRQCLDRTLFWTAADLEMKLLDFQRYYNGHRALRGWTAARRIRSLTVAGRASVRIDGTRTVVGCCTLQSRRDVCATDALATFETLAVSTRLNGVRLVPE
jgi:Integrase core domain